jgi:predicted O-methyltransferase YrrM
MARAKLRSILNASRPRTFVRSAAVRFSAKLISKAKQIGLQQIDREISALIAFLLTQQRNNMLEIGSAEGGSFYLWCKLFSGKKISLDFPTGNYGGIGITAARKRNREFKTWSRNIHGILADSHLMRSRQKVADYVNGKKLDFLFIDGDHSLLGVKLDYFMYREFVRPGGYIAFHDINGSRWHDDVGCLVSRFWLELKGEKQEFNSHREWGGIGLLKVGS